MEAGRFNASRSEVKKKKCQRVHIFATNVNVKVQSVSDSEFRSAAPSPPLRSLSRWRGCERERNDPNSSCLPPLSCTTLHLQTKQVLQRRWSGPTRLPAPPLLSKPLAWPRDVSGGQQPPGRLAAPRSTNGAAGRKRREVGHLQDEEVHSGEVKRQRGGEGESM